MGQVLGCLRRFGLFGLWYRYLFILIELRMVLCGDSAGGSLSDSTDSSREAIVEPLSFCVSVCGKVIFDKCG